MLSPKCWDTAIYISDAPYMEYLPTWKPRNVPFFEATGLLVLGVKLMELTATAVFPGTLVEKMATFKGKCR